MNSRVKYIETVALLAVVYVFYLVCNVLTPVVADDCSYASTGRTLADIAARQSADYMHWSGRVVAHSVAQLWGGIVGKGVFNFVNPLAMCLLVWLVAKAGVGRQRPAPALLAVAALLLWFFVPDQYVTQFMIAGSMNYMWASVLTLLFLLALRHVSGHRVNAWAGMGLAALALLAGAWSEMFAVCVVPALAVVLFARRKQLEPSAWVWAMLAAYAVGAAVVVLAPGNFARMTGLGGAEGHATPLATKVVNTAVYVLGGPLPWLWIAVLALWLVGRKHGGGAFWKESLFDVVAVAVAIGFCMLSGAAWPRTHFPAYLFSFTLLLRVVGCFNLKDWFGHVVVGVAAVLLAVDFGHEQGVMARQLSATHYVRQHAGGEQVLPWMCREVSRKSIGENTLSCNAANWRNKAFADYYEVPPVGVVPAEIYSRVVNAGRAGETQRFVLVPLPDSVAAGDVAGLRIVYSMDTLYKYPTKLSRLAALAGVNLGDRCYRSRSEASFMPRLLKEQVGLDQVLAMPADDDVACGMGMMEWQGKAFVYFSKESKQLSGLYMIGYEYVLR